MTGRKTDFAIVGGGLAGGLIALALHRARPDLSVVLIEAGDDLGGNHRWSWFASDLSPEGAALLQGFRLSEWDDGYDVRFPGHARRLTTPYRSLASADFDAALRRELPAAAILRASVAALDARGVTLASGEEIAARAVIDCRGPTPSPQLKGGWQVFMGRHLHTDRPHGIERPTIMDASVAQHGGYRFVYVLPLGAQEIFVEDTYYQDSPRLDRRALSSRIDAYCTAQGWYGEPLTHETGVLPVITGGDFASFQRAQRIPGVAVAGARGGFVHPLTSYTLPFAIQTALAIAADADLPGAQLAAMLEARARIHWRATRFYRTLGTMLFAAAEPEHRYRIFERFYRLPEDLIERFYAARSTPLDRARVLCGRPPVPLGRALAALAGRRSVAPLEQAA
ncbi:MAG: lycopene beta-cyclase CrtY [Novosphingobium sp.]